MLGALWIVCKALLILLAVLLGLVLVALILPITVELHYEKQELGAWVSVLGLRFRVYPWPQKKAAGRKKKKDRTKKRQSEKKQPQEQKAEQPKKKKLRLTADTLYSMVCTAGRALRFILSRLKVRRVRVRWPVFGGDAAGTALAYVKAQASLHSALAVLRNLLDIRFEELALVPDFNGEKQGSELFSCKIIANLLIMVVAGVRALIELIRAGVL